jgi:hypothetical protein
MRHPIIIIGVICLALSICGCACYPDVTGWISGNHGSPEEEHPVPAGQCVYIDHHIHVDGVLLEGESVGIAMDFPTYHFDTENRKLEGYMGFDVNDSLLVVYGDGGSLGGAMGGGAATMLSGAYALPYSENGLTISSVMDNGIVTIEYMNETIRLLPGEDWTRITSEIRMVDNYRGNMSRINVTTTDRIVNYGLLNKSDIVNTKGGQTVFY